MAKSQRQELAKNLSSLLIGLIIMLIKNYYKRFLKILYLAAMLQLLIQPVNLSTC
jgi:hypothetical protein